MAIITDTLIELEVDGGVRGLQGEKGDTGTSVTNIDIVDGDLVVTLSD